MNTPEEIEMPAPTAWPMVLAFGFTMIFAGFVTAVAVTILGAVIAVVGAVGWFRQVLPVEIHECVPVTPEEIVLQTRREIVERIAGPDVPRAWLPVEVHPISAGTKGGLAGGAVMAILAAVYGVLSGSGIWYAMNLLAAGFFPGMTAEPSTQIGTFNLNQFVVAILIHVLVSLLVGLLYGAMLPMLPQHPILLGGFIAPLLWSALIYGVLAFINPVMNEHIRWAWFVLSQVGFGIAAGLVVTVQERIPTRQNLPLAIRMGLEAPGLMEEHREERGR